MEGGLEGVEVEEGWCSDGGGLIERESGLCKGRKAGGREGGREGGTGQWCAARLAEVREGGREKDDESRREDDDVND